MNPIWLNAVRASDVQLDPDAAAIIAAMTVPPSGARRTLINNTVIALKNAGVWSLLDVMWFMAAHDSQASRLNWKAPASFTLTTAGTITFTLDRGWQGDGTTGYLNTNWSPSIGVNYQQTNASAGGYVQLANEIAGLLGGATSGGASGPTVLITLGNGNRCNSLFLGGNALTSAITTEGFYTIRRTAADAQQMLTNGVIGATNTTASSVRPTVALFFGARNDSGISPTNYSTNRLSHGFAAASMSEAQQLSFYNIVQSYMVAVGAAV